MHCDLLLIDIFRLVNQINLLLPSLNVTFNTVGRYYKERKKGFQALYDLLTEELEMLYGYVREGVMVVFMKY